MCLTLHVYVLSLNPRYPCQVSRSDISMVIHDLTHHAEAGPKFMYSYRSTKCLWQGRCLKLLDNGRTADHDYTTSSACELKRGDIQ